MPTYTLSDGTSGIGTLVGNVLQFQFDDGSGVKTGTINKDANGDGLTIDWIDGNGNAVEFRCFLTSESIDSILIIILCLGRFHFLWVYLCRSGRQYLRLKQDRHSYNDHGNSLVSFGLSMKKMKLDSEMRKIPKLV